MRKVICICMFIGLSVPLILYIGLQKMTLLNKLHKHDLRNGISTSSIDMRNRDISVAVGLAITSVKSNVLDQMPFFIELFPTFCKTASIGYTYSFYFAYDFNDRFFNNHTKLQTWKNKLTSFASHKCNHLGVIDVKLIKCNYSGKPAWAQNDAMMAAYRDRRDFFYRVNDDTVMTSSNWTHIFISELCKMDPPLLGVVGPTHRGGNTGILTYDFVHRTHIDIFGYYYPRKFKTWYADTWITRVYRPRWSKKLKTVSLRHVVRMHRYRAGRINKTDFQFVMNKTTSIIKTYVLSKKPHVNCTADLYL